MHLAGPGNGGSIDALWHHGLIKPRPNKVPTVTHVYLVPKAVHCTVDGTGFKETPFSPTKPQRLDARPVAARPLGRWIRTVTVP